MSTKIHEPPVKATHLLMVVAQEGSPRGYRVLNLPNDYRPLIKELAYRAVANEPGAAGGPWHLAIRLEDTDTPQPRLRLDACLVDRERPLARLCIPVQNLAWLARDMATELSLKGRFSFYVSVLSPNDPMVGKWSAATDDDADFEVDTQAAELQLPSQFTTEPIGPRRSVTRLGSWLRCVFKEDVFKEFVEAGAAENKVERCWVGATQLHLTKGGAYSVIEEILEVPAIMAGREYVRALGRDFMQRHQQLGGRLGAFLHLHPPRYKNVPLSPHPSGPDSVVAWNLDASTPLLVSLPITMFGSGCAAASALREAEEAVLAPAGAHLRNKQEKEPPSSTRPRIAAHGYADGLLSEIDLEVLI